MLSFCLGVAPAQAPLTRLQSVSNKDYSAIPCHSCAGCRKVAPRGYQYAVPQSINAFLRQKLVVAFIHFRLRAQPSPARVKVLEKYNSITFGLLPNIAFFSSTIDEVQSNLELT